VARLRPTAVMIAAAAVLVVGGAALASGVGSGDDEAPAVETTAAAATAVPTVAPARSVATDAAGTATLPGVAIDPALAIGDPRRLPLPAAGDLPGVLLTGSGSCVPGIIDLAAPGAPGQLALGAPACAVVRSPSGRFLATSTRFEPEGEPIVVVDTTTGAARTARRVGSAIGRGQTVISDRGAVATCEFAGTVIDTGRRTQRVPGSECGRIAIGNRILALRADGRTLVDATSRRRVITLARRVRGELPVLATSRSARLIAGFGFDKAAAFTFLTLYDRRGRVVTPRQQLTNAFRVRDAQLADDGRALALRSDAGWELFNLQTGDRLRQIGGTPITSATISPDGTRFAVATPQAIVFVDVATLAPQLAIPAQVRGVSWLDRAPAAS
jgi:hypothetical protein